MTPTVRYDRDTDAAYIRFSPEDADGRIVGMEVMGASRHLSPSILAVAA